MAREWTSRDPAYGVSLFTESYYADIWFSLRRVLIAFAAAHVLGVPLGLALGWSRRVHDYVFPVLELVRPIPILAWVPLAILMFSGNELPVLFLTFLAAFFATTLNTLLGVQSIDRDLLRAAAASARAGATCSAPWSSPARCRTSSPGCRSPWASPGSRLVAGEMIAGRHGLGYLINSSYTTTRYPTIVIAMITLGVVGYASSAAVRARRQPADDVALSIRERAARPTATWSRSTTARSRSRPASCT